MIDVLLRSASFGVYLMLLSGHQSHTRPSGAELVSGRVDGLLALVGDGVGGTVGLGDRSLAGLCEDPSLL